MVAPNGRLGDAICRGDGPLARSIGRDQRLSLQRRLHMADDSKDGCTDAAAVAAAASEPVASAGSPTQAAAKRARVIANNKTNSNNGMQWLLTLATAGDPPSLTHTHG